MKKNLLLFSAVVLLSVACHKSKQCVCKDKGGNVMSRTSKQSNSKKDVKQFEEDCLKDGIATTTNSGTTVTPCVLE